MEARDRPEDTCSDPTDRKIAVDDTCSADEWAHDSAIQTASSSMRSTGLTASEWAGDVGQPPPCSWGILRLDRWLAYHISVRFLHMEDTLMATAPGRAWSRLSTGIAAKMNAYLWAGFLARWINDAGHRSYCCG